MGTHVVEPGTVLADRYVVEDLLGEEGPADSWRARDKVLARSVVLQIVPSSTPEAVDLLDAAKRASHVTDSRVVQVLDAIDDGALSYVVREWATGQTLQVTLEDGPMQARRAAWLVREVALALEKAHRVGLPHLRLTPQAVIITKSSGVKVVGLGTFAALHDTRADAADPQRADTRDLGRLLYACLTARWPDTTCDGLAAAPTEHGRLLRPRQVRAGVPRTLDTLCDRILSDPPRVGEPITTVEEAHQALTEFLADDSPATTTGDFTPPVTDPAPAAEPPPALLTYNDGTDSPAPPDHAGYAAAANRSDTSTQVGRTLLWVIVVLLIVAGILVAYLLGKRGLDPGATVSPSDSTNATATSQTNTEATGANNAKPKPIAIAGAEDFDPPPDGNGEENSDEVKYATDGDPSTAWTTLHYYHDPHLGGLKPGVGLVVDLGKVHDVRRVVVHLKGKPTSLQLRAAPADADSMPTTSANQYRVVQKAPHAGTTATFRLHNAVHTRYLLVWLTKLPEDTPGKYWGRIAEIQVFG